MKWTKVVALFAVALLAASAVVAQTTGRIEGTVTDKDGAPLPGATVTASSPALQGDRVVTSGSAGEFRILALPPGTYSLRAELDGFNVVEAGNLSVGLDRTVTLELQMSPAFGEAVTVTTDAPTIDLRSTTTGASFGAELIGDLPTTRTFNGLAFNAPGVVTGGNPGGGAEEPSIGGASAAENRYVVDGLDTTDPAFGTIGSTLAFEFIEEVQVKTGGYEAEYGGALGGVLNVITKSGSNELSGDLFGYYNDDSLQEDAPPTTTLGQDLGFTEYDFGADLGGKFIQDRLWYFIAANPSYREVDFTTRSGEAVTTEVDRLYYAGKLTWQLNPSNQLVFSVFGDPTDRTNDAVSRNSMGLLAHDIEDGGQSFGLTYNATLGTNFLLEGAAGRYDQTEKQTPLDQGAFYSVSSSGAPLPVAAATGCSENGLVATGMVFNADCIGGTFHQVSGDRTRDDIRLAGSIFASTGPVEHEFKVGTNWRKVEYRDHANYPGGLAGPARDATGHVYDPGGLAGERWQLFDGAALGLPAGLLVARLIDYDQNSNGETDELSLFAQDKLRIGDYFTLNLGVRADQYTSEGDRSNLPNRDLDFSFGDTVAPRIGFTWDVARNGRSKLYGHYGRFYESVPLDINVRAFGNEQFQFYYFYFPDNGTTLPDVRTNPGIFFYEYPLGVGTSVDPDIEAMYSDEYVVGFEYEVATNWAAGIKYVTRELGNVIEDISVDGGHTYFITNPGGLISANPVTGEILDEPVLFPEAVREYEAFELTLSRRFSNNWQMVASYVNSENFGNYGGLFRQDNGQLDPNITSLFDLPDLLVGATGLLPNDREHQFKIYGSYVWPFKLVTGFSGQFLSGTPISKLGAHPVYGANERFVVPRGSAGRTDDVWNIDTHIEYPISFGGDLELKLIADIFNISDEQSATAVNQTWTNASRDNPTTPDVNEATCGGPGTGTGTTCPNGNQFWNTPTAYQTPRTFRLGVKLSW
jgi:outer membrane receptor protein involved in Fe transport